MGGRGHSALTHVGQQGHVAWAATRGEGATGICGAISKLGVGPSAIGGRGYHCLGWGHQHLEGAVARGEAHIWACTSCMRPGLTGYGFHLECVCKTTRTSDCSEAPPINLRALPQCVTLESFCSAGDTTALRLLLPYCCSTAAVLLQYCFSTVRLHRGSPTHASRGTSSTSRC